MQDLPLSWWMVVRFCPYCSGAGSDGEGRDCLQCEGTGDLFGSYLKAAHRLGQEDALFFLRSLHGHAQAALEGAQTSAEDTSAIKRRLGLK